MAQAKTHSIQKINCTFDITEPPLYNGSAKEVCCMKKSLFEQMDGTYTLVGDYYLPDIELPAEEDDRSLGV